MRGFMIPNEADEIRRGKPVERSRSVLMDPIFSPDSRLFIDLVATDCNGVLQMTRYSL